jgi:cephalosporin hydroxylase
MLRSRRRRDPEAPSGRFGADGTPIPNSMIPRGVHALYRRPLVRRLLARHFNRAYYYAMEDTLFGRRWLGSPTLKFPTDMWAYQEILAELRPAVVLESGTYRGGATLFFATILDALGDGRVVSVDLSSHGALPEHPRVTYVRGSSIDPEVVARVHDEIGDARPVFVILDSAHSCEHVLAELRAYGDLVEPGGYLIVEDTNLNGRPVLPDWGEGPAEAVERFLAERDDFEPDRTREQMLLTAAPGGFLRRVE